MDIGDQGPETRAKLEFIDLLPASKPRGIHAARERERLAQQQEALAGLDPAKAAAPLSSGSAPGARAAQLTFPTEPVGTELAIRTDTPQLTQDTSPVEGHSPWSASHPSDGRMVEDTSRWGDPLAAPFIHVTDQTQSDVGTLALPPSDTAAPQTYRARIAQDTAPLFAKGGKGQLQAAATAKSTEDMRRVEDRLRALEAAHAHTIGRCDAATAKVEGAEERCMRAEREISSIKSQLKVAMQGIGRLTEETEDLQRQAITAEAAIAAGRESMDSLYTSLSADIAALDSADHELAVRMAQVEEQVASEREGWERTAQNVGELTRRCAELAGGMRDIRRDLDEVVDGRRDDQGSAYFSAQMTRRRGARDDDSDIQSLASRRYAPRLSAPASAVRTPKPTADADGAEGASAASTIPTGGRTDNRKPNLELLEPRSLTSLLADPFETGSPSDDPWPHAQDAEAVLAAPHADHHPGNANHHSGGAVSQRPQH